MALKQKSPTMGYYFYPCLESDRYDLALYMTLPQKDTNKWRKENNISRNYKALLEFIRGDEDEDEEDGDHDDDDGKEVVKVKVKGEVKEEVGREVVKENVRVKVKDEAGAVIRRTRGRKKNRKRK